MQISRITRFFMVMLEMKVGYEVKYLFELKEVWRKLDEIEQRSGLEYQHLRECYNQAVKDTYQAMSSSISDEIIDLMFEKNDEDISFYMNPFEDKERCIQWNQYDKNELQKVMQQLYGQLDLRMSLKNSPSLLYISQTLIITMQKIENEKKKCDAFICDAFISKHAALKNAQDDLISKWEETPVFVEGLSLRDIYIEQYVYNINDYNDINSILEKKSSIEKNKLDHMVLNWFRGNGKMKGNVLYLLGEPGHGKSCFCTYMVNAFRHERIHVININKEHYVKYIKQGLNEDGSLKALFAHAYSTVENDIFDYLHNTLIIFDGYDEFVSTIDLDDTFSHKGRSILEIFHNKLLELLEQTRNTKIMITSRRSYLSENDIQYVLRKKSSILYLSELDMDTQISWIEAYNQKKPCKFNTKSLQDLKEQNSALYELTTIPILFQLIVEYNVTSDAKNKVELFEKLFDKTTIERGEVHSELGNDGRKSREALHRQLEHLAVVVQKDYDGDDKRDVIDTKECMDIDDSAINTFKLSVRCFYCNYKNSYNGKSYISFMHRSFYQHFLAYAIYHMLLDVSNNLENKGCIGAIRNFLRMMRYIPNERNARDELFCLIQDVVMYEMKRKIHPELNVKVFESIIDEIIKSQCIIGVVTNDPSKMKIEVNTIVIIEDEVVETSPITVANEVFVKSISLISIILKKTSWMLFDYSFEDNIMQKMHELFILLLKVFDCSNIILGKCFNCLLGENDNNSSRKQEKLSLIGIRFQNADLRGANFYNTNLIGANLIGANLNEVNLNEADLNKAVLSAAHLDKANLSGANVLRAELIMTSFIKADLSEIDLSESCLKGTDFEGANLENANLQNAELLKSNLTETKLPRAILRNANLMETSLCNADLYKADMQNACLIEADMRGANLKSANLIGANLIGADLTAINLTDIIYDETTKGLPQEMYDRLKTTMKELHE